MSVSTHDWSSWGLQPMRTLQHQDFNQSRLDHNREILLREPSVTVRLASGTWMYPSFEEPYGCNFCFGWGQLDEAHASIMDALLHGEIMGFCVGNFDTLLGFPIGFRRFSMRNHAKTNGFIYGNNTLLTNRIASMLAWVHHGSMCWTPWQGLAGWGAWAHTKLLACHLGPWDFEWETRGRPRSMNQWSWSKRLTNLFG